MKKYIILFIILAICFAFLVLKTLNYLSVKAEQENAIVGMERQKAMMDSVRHPSISREGMVSTFKVNEKGEFILVD